jgi:hypothetical protein
MENNIQMCVKKQIFEVVKIKNQLDATKYAVLLPQHVLGQSGHIL